MITETFGRMLFYDHFTEFPSPDFLKNKIMISTKPPEKEKTVETHSPVGKTKDKRKKKKNKEDPVKEEPWGQEIPSFMHDAEVDDKVI